MFLDYYHLIEVPVDLSDYSCFTDIILEKIQVKSNFGFWWKGESGVAGGEPLGIV